MIRFVPDTLRDALWRPISMAAPDAGVYVEIMAPDFRFAFLVVLTVASVVLALVRGTRISPTWLLLGFVWATFVPWLATTGNGRYFIAVLLAVGPLCVALVSQLPVSVFLRITAAALMVGLQAFALIQNSPWGWWGLMPWSDSYFQVSTSSEERSVPANYVSISSISYSLIIPQFDHRSRWINLTSLIGDPDRSIDDRRAQQFLEKAKADGLPQKLLVPSLPAWMDEQFQPNAALRGEMNRMLGPHRLAVSGSCKLLPARGIALMALRMPDKAQPVTLSKLGFWICPLQFPVARPVAKPATGSTAVADKVFRKLESNCPRIFQPGEATSVPVTDGFSRTYASSDTKAYVLDSGDVLYKYWRGLNPGRIGSIDAVLADDFRMDCNTIRGRSGLPWERKL